MLNMLPTSTSFEHHYSHVKWSSLTTQVLLTTQMLSLIAHCSCPSIFPNNNFYIIILLYLEYIDFKKLYHIKKIARIFLTCSLNVVDCYFYICVLCHIAHNHQCPCYLKKILLKLLFECTIPSQGSQERSQFSQRSCQVQEKFRVD